MLFVPFNKKSVKPIIMELKHIKHIFREYDIRGLIDLEITDDFVYSLGHALSQLFLETGQNRILLGYDTRKNSAHYHNILAKTFAENGLHVISLGMIPSPCLYFAVHYLQIKAGVIVTASHNPSQYNGFKIWLNECTINKQEILSLYEKITKLSLTKNKQNIQKGFIGYHDIQTSYTQKVLENIPPLNCKVVIDGANGSAGNLCVNIFQKAGAKVIPLFCDEQENFSNHEPDPTNPKNLKALCQKIIQEQADYGIALDGDGDRVVLVDNNARILKSDELMSIFIHHYCNTRNNPLFLLDVKCSQELIKEIIQKNGKYVLCPTGHAILKRNMIQTQAIFGGEFSGHFFHADNWYKTDDGILTAIRAIAILQNNNDSLTHYPNWLQNKSFFSSDEIKIPCPENLKQEKLQTIIQLIENKYSSQAQIIKIDGIRVLLENAWFLVRISNTSPAFTLRFEANEKEVFERLQNEIMQLVQENI